MAGHTYQVWFFAGGDHGKGPLNQFTGSFIGMMEDVHGLNFRIIEGIYNRFPFLNVFWALSYAQKPLRFPERSAKIMASYRQIVKESDHNQSELLLVSSSYGSVVAAQTACYLAHAVETKGILSRPFHVAIGVTMISKESMLYQRLLNFQAKGIIGNVIYDELQDEGDNSNGIAGTSRISAYLNALGICFPFLTRKYHGPSFLNKNPQTGHLHRRRAQSLAKAEDFMRVLYFTHRTE